MTRSVLGKRIVTMMIAIMVAFTFMPAVSQNTYAATKAPAKVTIKSATANANHVTVKWGKAKNAKKYKVFVQTGTDGWKYWKSVKATKKNKKKYSDRLKYRLKKSGKKYKIYKKKNPYRLVKTTTARKYTYTGKYSTTYRFVLQAVNGKRAGAYSAAKKATTKAKAKSSETSQPAQQETPTTPTDPATQADPATTTTPSTPQATKIPSPGDITNLKVTKTTSNGEPAAKVTWNASTNTTGYDVYVKKPGESYYTLKKSHTSFNKTGFKYKVTPGETYTFRVRPYNGSKRGNFVDVSYTFPTVTPAGQYSELFCASYNEYLVEMLGYYKAELNSRGVSIKSTNKADEFQKLQAIIQVMHDYVGLSEKVASDTSNFPTGRVNWYYNDNFAAIDGTDNSGDYYNGPDYIPTIKFYASCDIVAGTQEYLAKEAGLDVHMTGIVNSGHRYVMICANNVWYNADAWFYMAPGANGINTGWWDPSKFKESGYDIGQKLSSGTTYNITDRFKFARVFYGCGSSVFEDGDTAFITGSPDGSGAVSIVINPANATYTSSDESILSFDNNAGTCTFHKPGFVYVTITYQNLKSGGETPSVTTTISVKVVE